MYKIEKNIPLPRQNHSKTVYPFADMMVGDSFQVNNIQQNKISAAACMFVRNHKPMWKFSVRRPLGAKTGTFRVWRIK